MHKDVLNCPTMPSVHSLVMDENDFHELFQIANSMIYSMPFSGKILATILFTDMYCKFDRRNRDAVRKMVPKNVNFLNHPV